MGPHLENLGIEVTLESHVVGCVSPSTSYRQSFQNLAAPLCTPPCRPPDDDSLKVCILPPGMCLVGRSSAVSAASLSLPEEAGSPGPGRIQVSTPVCMSLRATPLLPGAVVGS